MISVFLFAKNDRQGYNQLYERWHLMRKHTVRLKHSLIVEAMGVIYSIQNPPLEGVTIPNEIVDAIKAIPTIDFLRKQADRQWYFIACEMLCDIDERHDIDAFTREYKALDDHRLRCWLLNYYYSYEEVSKIANDRKSWTKLLKDSHENGKDALIEYCLAPRVFFDDIVEAIKILVSSGLLEQMVASQFIDERNKKLDGIREELKERHPLSLSQGIMGKSFYNISDWDEYEFYYIYSLYPYTLRVSNDKRNVMLMSLVGKVWDEEVKVKSIQKKMKLLVDPNRMKLLRMIYGNPMFGKEIAKALECTTATVSHHLDLLRKEGLIHEERDKNTKYFSTNQVAFDRLLNEYQQYICKR